MVGLSPKSKGPTTGNARPLICPGSNGQGTAPLTPLTALVGATATTPGCNYLYIRQLSFDKQSILRTRLSHNNLVGPRGWNVKRHTTPRSYFVVRIASTYPSLVQQQIPVEGVDY